MGWIVRWRQWCGYPTGGQTREEVEHAIRKAGNGGQSLVLLGSGLAYFIWPQELTNVSGALLMTPAAVTDVRAWYGGLQLDLAAFLGLALSSPALLRAALTLQVLLLSALVLGVSAGCGWMAARSRRLI